MRADPIVYLSEVGYNEANRMHVPTRAITPFSLLSQEEFDHLVECGTSALYRDGATIVSEGREEARLIFLLEGGAKVSRINDKGKEVILAHFKAGDYFGEISLLTGSARTADVVATAACKTFEIDPDAFLRHTVRFTGLMQCMLSEMARRLHHTSERMVDSAFLEVPERLLKLLYALSSESGERTDLSRVVRECPPHQELAAMIGASREVVTRTLKLLESAGQIERQDKTIFLPVVGACP